MNMTKKATALLLALMMVLSLAACGGKQDNNKNDPAPAADMTAQQVLDTLKEKLGDSYGCDLAEDEDRMTNYYGLDLSQIDSWAAESSKNSALDASTAVVLKVKDGYAQDAAAALQTSYDQVLDYSKMYSMNLPMVQQARLFVSGAYVALLDHDDILHPCALWYVAQAIAEQGADFVYTDEVPFAGDNDHLTG